ncbi:MAG: nitrate- and nitrite sensing domain-containing protein [Actinomycetota bacterium]|nr:nitrate- and nitrite sensing domain-containing protein [Actinomycetota bacterium]
MILGRLGIRGKLNVLLLLPLAAVLLVATPFVAGEIDNARSAGRTEDLAGRTRDFGGLIWELQQERLLTAAYLAEPAMENTDLVRQHRIVDNAAAGAFNSLGESGSDELSSALIRLGSLRELRQSALRRGTSPDAVARTYHAAIGAILDALRLVPQQTSDAEGTRQLTVLDSLLRSNEENEMHGMSLIAFAVDPTTGQVILDNATAQARTLTERFVQQADVDHAGLVVAVDQGEVARRVATLAARLPIDGPLEAFVADALGTVQEHSRQRWTAQDEVTSEVTAAAAGRASNARWLAWSIGLGAAALFALVAFLALAVSRSIADPLRRLTTAATSVADLAESELVRVADTEVPEEQAPRLAAIEVATTDEIGKLAAAFNRVQFTASMLVERQTLTRHNVSLMFATVAQRTQNLVGRQLALVDEMERDEQDVRLLERLYQLDHVFTRLRRSADNLLVVAGTPDTRRLGGPIKLATALRSALAEIEDYRRVEFGSIVDATLAAPIGADLVLVFAELMENATAFSPPDSTVDINTRFLADGTCLIDIVDHGIGLPQDKLDDENRRLIERERLDIMPTTVLGLFVVGRLARRHAMRVELVLTEGGGITAQVAIPPESLLSHQPQPVLDTVLTDDRPPPLGLIPEFQIPSAAPAAGFVWFPGSEGTDGTNGTNGTDDTEGTAWIPVVREPRRALAQTPALAMTSDPLAGQAAVRKTAHTRAPVAAAKTASTPLPVAGPKTAPTPPPVTAPKTAPTPTPVKAESGRAGLRRRVAGAQLPGAGTSGPSAAPPPVTRGKHDPDAVKAAYDEFDTAFASASAPPAAPSPARPVDGSRGGLSRRVPGARLAPGLKPQSHGVPVPPPSAGRVRDPETERAAFDGFSTGLERASRGTDSNMTNDGAPRRGADPRGKRAQDD